MANYSEEVDDAFASIAEAGGVIKFRRRPQDDAPADGSYVWEGNDDEAPPFDHVAVFVPFSTVAVIAQNPFSECALIPAKGLPFPVIKGTVFETANGELYNVENVVPLRPDGVTMILYTCEVTTWAQT